MNAMMRDVGRFLKYARRLRPFLSRRLTAEECRQRLEAALRARDANFIRVLEKAVYGHPRSPYRALLLHAGLGLEDVRRSGDAARRRGRWDACTTRGCTSCS